MSRPPPELIQFFRPVFEHFLPRAEMLARGHPEAELTSWWRDRIDNRRVGGNPDSQHLFGFAFDLVVNDPEQTAEDARRLGFVAVVESDHVHLQFFPAGTLRRHGFFG